MGLLHSLTGEGKLINASCERRTWMEGDTEVTELVRTEDREWYALTESLVNAAMTAIYTDVYDPVECAESGSGYVTGVYFFLKETGTGTALSAGEKVYWNPNTDLITTTPGTLNLMGWVWEYTGDDDSEVIVMIARYTQNASITDPTIGAYTLTRNITGKMRSM